METNLAIRDSTAMDAEIMSCAMRLSDAVEAVAMGFGSPRKAIHESVLASREAWTVTNHGEGMVAMFGLVHVKESPSFAMPWLCVAPIIRDYKVSLFRISRSAIDGWSREFSLYNWVHEKNVESMEFIDALGFNVEADAALIPGSPSDENFHLFWMGDKPCVSLLRE